MTQTDSSNDQAYNQFSELLNKSEPESSTPGSSTPAPSDSITDAAQQEPNASPATDAADDLLQKQYTEFANRLGIDDDQQKTPLEPMRDVIERAKPRQAVEIDPGDYTKFDGLLSRTGGTGRKTQKGSKRWETSTTAKSASGETGADRAGKEPSDQPPMPRGPMQEQSVFSEEDAADGYAVLTEQFGMGFHDAIDRSESTSTERPPRKPRKEDGPVLQRPPSRPADLSESQLTKDVPRTAYVSGTPVPSAEPPPELIDAPKLQPKPVVSQETLNGSDDVALRQEERSPVLEVKPARSEAPIPALEGKPVRPGTSPPPGNDEPESIVEPFEVLAPIELRSKPARPESAESLEVPAPTELQSKSARPESAESLEVPAPVELQSKPARPESAPPQMVDDEASEKMRVEDMSIGQGVEKEGLKGWVDGGEDSISKDAVSAQGENAEDGDLFVMGVDDADGFTTIMDGITSTEDSEEGQEELSDSGAQDSLDGDTWEAKRRRVQFWQNRGGRKAINVPYQPKGSTPSENQMWSRMPETLRLQNPKLLYPSEE